nr:BREX-1 system adenine-specific DNA-methyltransferase PglX [Bifidobacterium lemurum]
MSERSESKALLSIITPESLTVCDPACGSGHMLTYAFDLLYQIYEDEGYSPSEIPGLILKHNLFGMEIDERAANLAAFALTMKARAKSRRFFRNQVLPNIQLIAEEEFNSTEIEDLNRLYDVTLDEDVWNTYANADVEGSLIIPPSELSQLKELRWQDVPNDVTWNDLSLMGSDTLSRVGTVIRQSQLLSNQYACVVANPPYMGGKNMGSDLKRYVQDHFEDGKADLFAAFMLRNLHLVESNGVLAMVTMQSWMFLSSFESMRQLLLANTEISTMAHLGAGAFDAIGGEVVSTTAFTLAKHEPQSAGIYTRLVDVHGDQAQADAFAAENSEPSGLRYTVNQSEFAQIPGSPIVYWLSEAMLHAFSSGKPLSEFAQLKNGMSTGNNDSVLRQWFEISFDDFTDDCVSNNSVDLYGKKWFPYNKGGEYRKWYGNASSVIRYDVYGREYMASLKGSRPNSPHLYFLPCVSWSKVSSGTTAFRLFPKGFVFDVAGCSMFPTDNTLLWPLLAFGNSSVAQQLLMAISPTLNFEAGQLARLPFYLTENSAAVNLAHEMVHMAQTDWDSFETSWSYEKNDLLKSADKMFSLEQSVVRLYEHWNEQSHIQQSNEIRNNEIVAKVYDVVGDVPTDVPLERVSLKRNAAFAYPKNTPAERDELFACDVVKELISYAVGCMFGRYGLDKPGLILASQGETIADYLKHVPEPSFMPDEDNVIPVTETDCFGDDIVSRFRRFLEVAFGKDHLTENVAYIERVLGKPLRKYFVNDFYNDHVKMYSNRPIYWQYSSRTDNKGAFKALVYLHRCTPQTTGKVLEYLRDFTVKIADQAMQLDKSDRAQDKREAEKLRRAVTECKAYEDDVLYPLATRNLEMDLDDGVLVNYLRMGKALRAIPAIERKRQEVSTWTWPVHPLEGKAEY